MVSYREFLLDLKANIFLYCVRVEQEHSYLSSINEDYYARVEQEHSHLSSIDEDVAEENVSAVIIQNT